MCGRPLSCLWRRWCKYPEHTSFVNGYSAGNNSTDVRTAVRSYKDSNGLYCSTSAGCGGWAGVFRILSLKLRQEFQDVGFGYGLAVGQGFPASSSDKSAAIAKITDYNTIPSQYRDAQTTASWKVWAPGTSENSAAPAGTQRPRHSARAKTKGYRQRP